MPTSSPRPRRSPSNDLFKQHRERSQMNPDIFRNFVAIDFETATQYSNSACSVAAVRVVDGDITDEFYELIQPPYNDYRPMNIHIHGIHPEHTADAPSFAGLWPKLHNFIGEGPLFAHNAPFDKGVLNKSSAYYRITPPAYEYHCSCRLARKLVPGLQRYSLDVVSRHFEIELQHHHALSDAKACAKIAIRLHDFL